MTPHQSDVPSRVVGGIFLVAFIGLFILFGSGYHTLLLILIGVMFGIGALTFTYARRSTLEGLFLIALIGMLSLYFQGYQTIFLVIVGTIFGISALAFIYYDGQHVWSWWFPDQPFNPTIKRWLRYLLQAITAALAYAHVRFYINGVTSVDPGNFPTALTALTALNTLVLWLVILPLIMQVTAYIYAGVAYIAGLQGGFDPAEIGGISAGRWRFRAFGAFSLGLIGVALALVLVAHPSAQRVGRVIATHVLVATEFSYDQTCAVSTEHRLVAQLKDRRERQVSMVAIAEEGSRVLWILRHFTFSTGTCADQVQP